MPLNSAINSSENVLVVKLDSARLEDIVEEWLDYFLKNKKSNVQNILKQFYEPVEKACIEFNLKKQKGNQVKTAQVLGINRNTLKKKIGNYNLSVEKKSLKSEEPGYFESRISVSAVHSFDLLSVCRTKLAVDDFEKSSPAENFLKQLCYPVEQKIIKKVLEHYKGNQIRSSTALGINRNTLKKKIKLKNSGRTG